MRGQSLLFVPLEAPEEQRQRLRATERRNTDGKWWQLVAQLPGSDEPLADVEGQAVDQHLGKAGPAC